MKYFFLICGLTLSFFTNGQLVNSTFDKIVIEENFSYLNKNWPYIFNTENLTIMQPGHYEMMRKNQKTGNYIFPKFGKQFNSFELMYAVSFSKKTHKEASSGVLLMAKEEVGILVEVNNNSSYRVQKVSSSEENILYTNSEGDGWVKNKKAFNKNINILKVRTAGKKYDIYINDNFLYSFTELSLNSGNIGVYIGPNSHAYIKSFVLKTSSEVSEVKEAKPSDSPEMKVQLRIKQAEIDRLKAMLDNNSKNVRENMELQSQIEQLNLLIERKNKYIDSVENINAELSYFKKAIGDRINGTSIDGVYEKIKDLRRDSAALSQNLNIVKESNANKQKELGDLRNKYEVLKKRNEAEIQFLLRQIDWINQKFGTDSIGKIDSLRSMGTGYLYPDRRPFKFKNIQLKNKYA